MSEVNQCIINYEEIKSKISKTTLNNITSINSPSADQESIVSKKQKPIL